MATQCIDRRLFLTGCSVIGGGVLLPGTSTMAAQPIAPDDPPGAQHDRDLVRRMVGASHGNLDGVRELLHEDPELAKATWDWGFGDWESALGAAAHTGSRDIALLLIEHGARINIFCAAMFGQLAVVRALIEAQPGIQRTPGPHGLTLMQHARTGGEAAHAVVEYLEAVGDADLRSQPATFSPRELEQLTGAYRLEDGSSHQIILEARDDRDGIWLRYVDGTTRRLFATEERDTFHFSAARSIRTVIERDANGNGVRLRIRWAGGREIAAHRLPA